MKTQVIFLVVIATLLTGCAEAASANMAISLNVVLIFSFINIIVSLVVKNRLGVIASIIIIFICYIFGYSQNGKVIKMEFPFATGMTQEEIMKNN